MNDTATPETIAPLSKERRAPGAHEKRRTLAKLLRRVLLGLFIAGAVALAVIALRPRPVPVDIARAARGPLTYAIEESGTTRVKDRYLVSAPVTGNVSRITIEPGDVVKEGDVVAEIAPALSPLLDARTRSEADARLGASLSALGQAKSQQARATAAKESSTRDLEKMRALVASGSMAKQALEDAEFADRMRAEELQSTIFAGKVAAEEVRLARAALGTNDPTHDRHVDVVSPISGSVLRVQQKSAGVVQPGTALIELGDPSVLEVVVDLLTTEAVQVKTGTQVTIQGWGGDGALAGRVRRIEPAAFTKPSALGVDEQRVNVIVSLTDPREKWALLGDGYRVEARLVLWHSDDVLEVPQGAVFRHGDAWAVYRIDNGIARLVPVTIGHRGERDVEITSGLDAGASVVVHPGDRVKDGARVEGR